MSCSCEVMRVSLAMVLALSGAAAACSAEAGPSGPPAAGGDTPAAAPPQEAPALTNTLAKVPCRFFVPKSVEGQSFYCADVSVPEDRRNPASPKIKIHVGVIKGKPNGVPTIELIGGPGGGSEPLIGGVAAGGKKMLEVYGRFLAQGDLVFFDQRGTGRSEPRLACGFDESPAKCKDKLVAKGINLAAYDTVENADDVHEIKVALGVPKVDLHGISYGTRLGIEILKRHPDDVRAAIIDGVMPSDVSVGGGFEVAMDGILTTVFKACAANATCNTKYPDLDGALGRLKTKLNTTPFKGEGEESGGFEYNFDAFMSEIVQRSYEDGAAAKFPHLIHSLLSQTEAEWNAAQKADAEALEELIAAEDALDEGNPLMKELREIEMDASEAEWEATELAQGMYLSVTCNDYTQHESFETALAAMGTIRPELRSEGLLREEFDSCKTWPVRVSDPNLKKAPTFGGPVLVIGGRLDPATPAIWAERVAATLPAHQLVVVPTGGHGLMDACGATLKDSFFANPTAPLDASCATNRKLEFYYPPTQHMLRPIGTAHVVLPPAKTASQIIAQRVNAAARPSLGVAAMLRDRKIAKKRH
jgi:pimeloyl-ACP methyl ester carboxylesterase